MAGITGIIKSCAAKPAGEQPADDAAVDHANCIAPTRHNVPQRTRRPVGGLTAALAAGADRVLAALVAPVPEFRVILQLLIASHLKMAEVDLPQIAHDLVRPFAEQDAKALLDILGDTEVNTFLPMFPLKHLEEAEAYLHKKLAALRSSESLLYDAVCMKGSDVPVGYVHVSGAGSHDLGYGLRKAFWHRGLCTEACRAIIDQLRRDGLPYVTATHNVNNPRSGNVMQAIGMKYRYSYRELWQPKNILVVFRMYQLNLDGQEERIYDEYRNKYPHFIKEL